MTSPAYLVARMVCGCSARRHVDAFGIVVGADEIDVFGRQVGADAAEKIAQVRTRPLSDIVPALDANMPDDDVLLRQLVNLLRRPRLFVGDAAEEFQLPGRAVDRFDVLDIVIGVKARRLDHLRRRECRRQMVRPEYRLLYAVVPGRHGAQELLHGRFLADVAARQQAERAKTDRAANKTDRAANEAATIDLADQRPRRCRHAPGSQDWRRRKSNRHRFTASLLDSWLDSRRGLELRVDGSGAALVVIDDGPAGHHGDEALRHQ